ncbi:hypothetical protein TorRG33x02_039060 [Trema orientale]|uniref:Uncharacterized protein n=1 Tax=Trema orientale TaxID=63057 RepID=A0A2P5FQP2_TREOI|nr:hypothetical protein TorRG33x02_039060 [Trema orientale]
MGAPRESSVALLANPSRFRSNRANLVSSTSGAVRMEPPSRARRCTPLAIGMSFNMNPPAKSKDKR